MLRSGLELPPWRQAACTDGQWRERERDCGAGTSENERQTVGANNKYVTLSLAVQRLASFASSVLRCASQAAPGDARAVKE